MLVKSFSVKEPSLCPWLCECDWLAFVLSSSFHPPISLSSAIPLKSANLALLTDETHRLNIKGIISQRLKNLIPNVLSLLSDIKHFFFFEEQRKEFFVLSLMPVRSWSYTMGFYRFSREDTWQGSVTHCIRNKLRVHNFNLFLSYDSQGSNEENVQNAKQRLTIKWSKKKKNTLLFRRKLFFLFRLWQHFAEIWTR